MPSHYHAQQAAFFGSPVVGNAGHGTAGSVVVSPTTADTTQQPSPQPPFHGHSFFSTSSSVRVRPGVTVHVAPPPPSQYAPHDPFAGFDAVAAHFTDFGGMPPPPPQQQQQQEDESRRFWEVFGANNTAAVDGGVMMDDATTVAAARFAADVMDFWPGGEEGDQQNPPADATAPLDAQASRWGESYEDSRSIAIGAGSSTTSRATGGGAVSSSAAGVIGPAVNRGRGYRGGRHQPPSWMEHAFASPSAPPALPNGRFGPPPPAYSDAGMPPPPPPAYQAPPTEGPAPIAPSATYVQHTASLAALPRAFVQQRQYQQHNQFAGWDKMV
jgi:hypothetical protein